MLIRTHVIEIDTLVSEVDKLVNDLKFFKFDKQW